MRRKGILFGAWAVVTLSATLVAWAAVRQVTDEVSPAQTLPFPSAVALADEGATPPAPVAEQEQEQEQEEAAAPARPAPEAPAVTQAYDLTGGVVTVRYRGETTTLVSATPNSGFGVEVNDGGPGKVDVRFRSDRHESRLVTRWRDGAPDPQREERPR